MNQPPQPPIPFVDLQAQFAALEPEIMKGIRGVASSATFIRSAALEEFERAFARLHGVSHAIGVGSGTDALNLAALIRAWIPYRPQSRSRSGRLLVTLKHYPLS